MGDEMIHFKGTELLDGSDAGTVMYPPPMIDSFVPYDPFTLGHAPPKERSFWAPYSNATAPYWFVTEVEV